jgi:hypothetical protein
LFGSSVAHSSSRESCCSQIFEDFTEDSVIAHVAAVLEWDVYFKNILHQGTNGIVIVVEGSCSEVFFEINGPVNISVTGTTTVWNTTVLVRMTHLPTSEK